MSVCRDHLSIGLRSWCLLVTALTWACSGPSTPERDGTPVIFADVTTAAGIDFLHVDGFSGDYYYVQTFGSGAAFVDVDGDGWQDVYLANGTLLAADADSARNADPPINHLYRNQLATFTDITDGSGAGDTGYSTGCAVAATTTTTATRISM